MVDMSMRIGLCTSKTERIVWTAKYVADTLKKRILDRSSDLILRGTLLPSLLIILYNTYIIIIVSD